MGLTQYAESNTIQGLGNRDQIGRQVPDVGGQGERRGSEGTDSQVYDG